MAQQQGHPRNPARARLTNLPRERGNTRTQAGRLEFEDSMDNTWKPAVRLETLRPRLIQEAPPRLYTHAKEKGYDTTDVTTFLAKDQPYGSDRNHRDPLLFQITSTGVRGKKPSGYLKDGGLIVLDAFNHGIRDFPSVLPKCLSTNLGGYDIMNYFRQNEYITLYDLLARMPNGYHEMDSLGQVSWHEGPPRYGTVGMRATRFRLHAGLLSWKRRTGSDAKNAKILELIPANCKDPRVNSTASHRDFTEAEQKEVRKVLVGSAPNRGRRSIKDDVRGDEQDLEAYEEDSEAIVEEVEEAEEARPLKALPGLQDQDARSVHFEDRGDHGPLARTVHAAKDSRWISGDQRINREQSTIPKVGHSPSEGPFLGTFSNPILVRGTSDGPAQAKIARASDSGPNPHEALAKRQRATHPKPLSKPNNNHTLDDLEGTTMVDTDTELKDYRYMDPHTHKERTAIQQALELTREDFRQRTKMSVPPLLATKFADEDYNSQRLRLQEVFSRVWDGFGRTPQLYRLPAWYAGFENWRIADAKGMELYSNVLE